MTKRIMREKTYFLAALSALTCSAHAEINMRNYTVGIDPISPTTLSALYLTFERQPNSCIGVQNNLVTFDSVQRKIDVSISVGPADFTGCPFPMIQHEALGSAALQGTYLVTVYEENPSQETFLADENMIGSFSVDIGRANPLSNAETPSEGSVQSGVGLIRGWACDAQRVEIQVDDLPRLRVAYGSSRADTAEVCGDENNGYGLAIAWGLFGEGNHVMKTYIDGMKRHEVEFEVVGLDEPFMTGLSGSYRLADFPTPDESVVIGWSEADQNFLIIEHAR